MIKINNQFISRSVASLVMMPVQRGSDWCFILMTRAEYLQDSISGWLFDKHVNDRSPTVQMACRGLSKADICTTNAHWLEEVVRRLSLLGDAEHSVSVVYQDQSPSVPQQLDDYLDGLTDAQFQALGIYMTSTAQMLFEPIDQGWFVEPDVPLENTASVVSFQPLVQRTHLFGFDLDAGAYIAIRHPESNAGMIYVTSALLPRLQDIPTSTARYGARGALTGHSMGGDDDNSYDYKMNKCSATHNSWFQGTPTLRSGNIVSAQDRDEVHTFLRNAGGQALYGHDHFLAFDAERNKLKGKGKAPSFLPDRYGKIRSHVGWQNLWSAILTNAVISIVGIPTLTRLEDYDPNRTLGPACQEDLLIQFIQACFDETYHTPHTRFMPDVIPGATSFPDVETEDIFSVLNAYSTSTKDSYRYITAFVLKSEYQQSSYGAQSLQYELPIYHKIDQPQDASANVYDYVLEKIDFKTGENWAHDARGGYHSKYGCKMPDPIQKGVVFSESDSFEKPIPEVRVPLVMVSSSIAGGALGGYLWLSPSVVVANSSMVLDDTLGNRSQVPSGEFMSDGKVVEDGSQSTPRIPNGIQGKSYIGGYC